MNIDGFPFDPVIDDLREGMSGTQRFEFANRVLAEHGDRIGDYLFAVVHHAATMRDADAAARLARSIDMAELMKRIQGQAILMTFRVSDPTSTNKSRDNEAERDFALRLKPRRPDPVRIAKELKNEYAASRELSECRRR